MPVVINPFKCRFCTTVILACACIFAIINQDNMETIQLNKDIRVLCAEADSFPDGVMEAWQKLHSLYPPVSGRHYYGLSRGNKNGGIDYMAAVEESFPGEAPKPGCKAFIIPNGEYISETLKDWKKNMTMIGTTFQKLLKDPRMDLNGFCLEEYFNDNDVRCMVKMK